MLLFVYHLSCHQEFLIVGHGLHWSFLLSSVTISLCFTQNPSVTSSKKNIIISPSRSVIIQSFFIWSFWEEPEASHCPSGNVCHPSLPSELPEKLELHPKPESSSECPELRLISILVYTEPNPHGAIGDLGATMALKPKKQHILPREVWRAMTVSSIPLLAYYWLKNQGSLHQVLC